MGHDGQQETTDHDGACVCNADMKSANDVSLKPPSIVSKHSMAGQCDLFLQADSKTCPGHTKPWTDRVPPP